MTVWDHQRIVNTYDPLPKPSMSLLYDRVLRRRAVLQAELAELSRTDVLTGLPNRRRFEETFERVWAAAQRTRRPVWLLVVDADHFKRYNDRCGHAVGDEVLKGLAGCLSASVHRPDDLVARVGGEEFVILLLETDEDGALRIAGKLHEAVASLPVLSAGIGSGSVTVSVGLAVRLADAASSNDLYRKADAALCATKEGGRNKTRCPPNLRTEPPQSFRSARLAPDPERSGDMPSPERNATRLKANRTFERENHRKTTQVNEVGRPRRHNEPRVEQRSGTLRR